METTLEGSRGKSRALGLGVGIVALVLFGGYFAASALGISSGLATNLYFVLQGISWAGLAVGIVAGFGIGAALASTIFGLVKRWALRKFVAW